ncbi:MAG: FecR domain-containing protein [Tannerella sp.]|jgi:ferric-dicitrate binding protein FerR (iron transport regulator)|nr:FecR domain-containing protein [Tannerella sp.]
MPEIIDHIIARVICGEASADDILQLSRWLDERDENKQIFVRLKAYWSIKSSKNKDVDMLREIRKFRLSPSAKSVARPWYIYVAAAAVVISLIISAMSLFYVRSVNNVSAPAPEVFYTRITDGNRSVFNMKDGTKVTLNKNSSLTFAESFGQENRRVKLSGEAFFDVAHNPELPFEVTLDVDNDVSIKVLGTEFGAKTDTVKAMIFATLLSGVICFDSDGRTITMTPDQQLTYTCSSRKAVVSNVDAESALAWKDGLLKYKSIALYKMMSDLEKIYDVKISITDEKLTDPSVVVSGTFEEGQSLEQIFAVISRSMPLKWKKNDGKYYLYL